MSIKKLLEEQESGFINLHAVLVSLSQIDGTSYQDAAKFLYRLLTNEMAWRDIDDKDEWQHLPQFMEKNDLLGVYIEPDSKESGYAALTDAIREGERLENFEVGFLVKEVEPFIKQFLPSFSIVTKSKGPCVIQKNGVTELSPILEKPIDSLSVERPPIANDRFYVSDKLAKMNQAAAKFWANANRSDRGTHPDNATVSAWLEQQGFSATLADKAATIMRPEWAPTGRKPEE